jgi:hypothetical protein
MRYTIPEAARLLAVSADALRKRVAAGRLDAEIVDGVWFVDSATIDEERAELLRRLGALDTRLHEVADVREVAALQDELTRLRGELERVRSVADALAEASDGLQQANRAHLDAVRQFLTPHTIEG